MMEATAVSLARSVLDGVLSRAGTAVADEVARLIGVRKEVDFIRNELAMMQAFLRVASARPEATVRNDTTKTWVKQVRDLAYDLEDCLLDFALYAATTSASRGASWLPSAVAERHRIASRIRDLKASVEALNQRNQRYHIAVAAATEAHHQPVSSSLPPPEHYDDVRSAKNKPACDIIGRDGEKKAVIRLLAEIDGALRVVSVWGMGGMGKSSLVRKVYNDADLLGEFDCGAWVTVPHPLDSPAEFTRRLKKELGLDDSSKDIEIEKHLWNKRYLVVVDDLRNKDEWDSIFQVFQFDRKRPDSSRIIVTTRLEDVARHCARAGAGAGNVAEGQRKLIYELKPLNDHESKSLLCQKVRRPYPNDPRRFKDMKVYKKSDFILPPDMEEQANNILKICWGLPLAISTIGGFLANRPKKSIEWRNLHEHIGAELECDLHDITKVIISSYDGLPYHLKSIFLYLSIFPENHEIRRTRLLRRWMAEGYITKNRDMPVEDVAERFYRELINRSMIQGSSASYGVGADRCQVHSMVLHIIRSKFIEENQLFLIEKHSTEIPQRKIRHLVVSKWEVTQGRDEKLRSINPTYIRSLTCFGDYPTFLISPKMRLLRVLDLEDTINLKNEDLKHIGELRHLRYLSLRGTDISKLPSSLQNLQYLETLDIQDTRVTQLPGGVAKLEKLWYLQVGINFSKDLLQKMDLEKHNDNIFNMTLRSPEGIDKLQNLHMLGVINVGNGNDAAGRIKKLTNLTNLRRLGVAGVSEKEGHGLCQLISKLKRLQRLELRSHSLTFLSKMDDGQGMTIPKHLVSLRLCGSIKSLPNWIGSLGDLAKVKLLGTQLEQKDIERLENLRNLTLLGLWKKSYIGDYLHFGYGTFPKLKFLDIDELHEIETVTIEEGAMPELKKLWVNNCPSLHDDESGLSGVPHLKNLNEVLLKKCGEKENLTKILQRQTSDHSKRPRLLVGRSIVPTSPSAQIVEQ
ncbi:hypothetical protein U9M48_014913 [Paspalum notatum var. saurae]|uniref:Uncharacterized protein n=1 Tax=Paspalum notatum var. saurae TaxID=547442 RepID=A0AAQ3T3T1_PASNO